MPEVTKSESQQLGSTSKRVEGPSEVGEAQLTKAAPRSVAVQSSRAAGQRARTMLRARLGEDVFTSWFASMEFEGVDGATAQVSVPVKFLKNWIQTHYSDELLACCAAEFAGVERVNVTVREPGLATGRPAADAEQARPAQGSELPTLGTAAPALQPASPSQTVTPGRQGSIRLETQGLEGSPLDPGYTFDNFVVAAPNRMAHAGASQVAETICTGSREFNPLYIHSQVGLGKTHLLHAIAWEARRRMPQANIIYLTAERFRYQFVEALREQDGMSFKDRFRNVDLLLVDDLEFMHGAQTELEFDTITNTLLDSGRQLVVASARPASQLDRLSERLRSRLRRGLVTEIGGFDYDLRLAILEKRFAAKRQLDPSFEVPRAVLELLADRLTENGRELEGAINRLHATWQYMRTPITIEVTETIIRDLVQGVEPRRIKIDDILRVVSRHFGVTKGDILSQRRHRSVVWPRQIGMYLAKQMTARSLPEIGRRFGNRDHTTVLHAIRKIEGVLEGDTRLRDEIEDLKRLLNG